VSGYLFLGARGMANYCIKTYCWKRRKLRGKKRNIAENKTY
jgi:hypothetical protein